MLPEEEDGGSCSLFPSLPQRSPPGRAHCFQRSSLFDSHSLHRLLCSINVLTTSFYTHFSRAAITNDHKPEVFNQRKCILSQLWRPEVRNQLSLDQNQGVSRAAVPPKPLGENPCLLQLPAAASTPLASGCMTQSLLLSLLSPISHRDLGPTHLTQNDFT